VRALPLGVAAERSVHYIWYYCQAQPNLSFRWSELSLFSLSPAHGLHNIAYGLYNIANGLYNIAYGLYNIANLLYNIAYGLNIIADGLMFQI
jgi:hypothetical protein